jgi:hypothetical protein
MEIELKVDMRGFARGMTDIATRQLPYAMATALTATAGHVGLAWQDEMDQELDNPTPFTRKSVGVRGARKSDLTAVVFIRPIAAQYLEPFVEGGLHFLGGKRGLLGPRNVALNAYGNLPRTKLSTLKAKGNVFVGPVRTKGGQVVNGVWQRTGGRVKAAGKRRAAAPVKVAGALKLLIRFADPKPVTQHLDFRGRAEAAIRANFQAEFARAFAHAQATAK